MALSKNEFGKKIKSIRESKNFSTRQVAIRANTSQPYISQVENGKRNIPKPATLEKLARGLRISKSEMFKLAGLEPSLPDNVEPISKSQMVDVPVLGEIACGEPITAIENVETHIALPASMVKNGNYFILKCIGNSMKPTISDGSKVLVREQPDVESGQIAAVLLDDDTTATLKRVKKTKNTILLMPDNPSYEPIALNEDTPGRIIGLVKMEMKMF